MIFTKLILEDFGLFGGQHEFDLRPVNSGAKPIVIFGGMNGSGKTTILQAVRLCLYGQGFQGSRLTKHEYEQYLRDRIHRNRQTSLSSARVGLEFEYTHLGKSDVYSVNRSWQVQDSRVIETLEVLRNSEPLPDLEADQWQDFLRELIPQSLSQLFFFDGERIQNLAEDESHGDVLSESLKSLLGLDLVDRLQADLRIYSTRQMKEAGAGEIERKITELLEEQKQLAANLEALRQQRASLQSQVDHVQSAIERQEQKIASEGGSFSKKRGNLKALAEKLDSEIKSVEEQLRELCMGLFPFSIVPTLSKSLKDRLTQEERYLQWQAARRILERRLRKVEREIRSHLEMLPVPEESKTDTASRILKSLRSLVSEVPGEFQRTTLIHQLSPPEQRKIMGWLDQAQEAVPQQFTTLARKLEKLTRQRQETENALSRVPSDEVLHPLVTRLNELHQQLGQLRQQHTNLEEETRQMEFRLKEVERRLNVQHELQTKHEALSSRLALVEKTQKVLGEYFVRLRDEKTRELSQALTECFRGLAWKGNVIERIEVLPDDFSIVLYERGEQALPKEQLSAGEKQIYATAMLWALARTSGRPLPFIIDTPLGRLDSEHRRSLVLNFFPKAGHQVIILSTDTEIDQEYFKLLQPFIAHSYHLEFDKAEGHTRVSPGYFWGKQAVLSVISP